MASFKASGSGDYENLCRDFEAHVMQSGMSVEITDFFSQKIGETKIGLFVIEKYYYRVQNQISLTVQIIEHNGNLFVNAVSSGASSGVFLKIDWGAEEDFLDTARNFFISSGFQIENVN